MGMSRANLRNFPKAKKEGTNMVKMNTGSTKSGNKGEAFGSVDVSEEQ
jgi:hypothetical protein